METKVIEVNALTIDELVKNLKIDLENYVIVKNGKVVTDFSEKIKQNDTIKIIEAVGGG